MCKCLYWVDDAAYYDKEIPGTVHLKCTPKVRYEYWGTHQLPALHFGDYFYFSFFFAAKFRSIRKEATNPAPPKRRVHEP